MEMTIFLFCFLCFSGVFAKLDTEWWKHTIIYEIIPYTFKDSDGDGIGDLKGITSKLDHFVDLGIETIHLTPTFETTSRDIGYDITDYYKIEPTLGTMYDFDELVREMKKRNMKLMLDLVINHSSHKHEWFEKSIDRIEPYTDFYVWKNSKGIDNKTQEQIPPNNWMGTFTGLSGSGWTWNEKRQQFYFHQFLEEQPDFDLDNEILKKELKKMIKFWMDKDVAGFRLDATPFYFEDKEFRDNDNYQYRQYDEQRALDFIHEFRLFLDEYNEVHGGIERIFVAEAHDSYQTVAKYYGKKDYPITHFPYTFILEDHDSPINSWYLEFTVRYWMQIIPEGAVSAWMTQDHDVHRVGSRIAPEYSDIFTMLSMMLPGTVGVYYGQEIAMENGFITDDQIKDFSGKGTRDPARLVMQWDDTVNAGFSTNTTSTYLPTNTDYFIRNVEMQKSQEVSHYNMFKDLSALRKTDVFELGNFEINATTSDSIYIVTRSYKQNMLVVVINFSTIFSRVNLTKALQNPPNRVTVAAASINSGYRKGFVVKHGALDEFFMRPLSSLVFQTNNPNIARMKADIF